MNQKYVCGEEDEDGEEEDVILPTDLDMSHKSR